MDVSLGLPNVAPSLLSIVTQAQQSRDRIISNVLAFVNRVLDEKAPDKHLLAQYCCAMILFLWKHENYNLDSILQGLHKQSVTSVHSYLCPDLKISTNQEDVIVSDPYKEATAKLQEISSTKPQVCRFCKKESVFTYTSVQTRSADEGMTTFVTCSLCGKRQRT